MIEHKEDDIYSQNRRLVAFYVSNPLWTAFDECAKKQGTNVFMLLRRLMRSHIIDEEARGN